MTTKTSNWVRVGKDRKCPICLHPDWCAISYSLGLVHCLRVVSQRPSKSSLGGYIHKLGDGPAVQPKREQAPVPTIDAEKLMQKWHDSTSTKDLDTEAVKLGVTCHALVGLRCGWAPEHQSWSFPMRNGSGTVVGIRLRAENGRKLSVKGGHEGVFQPFCDPQQTVFCPEGPTDTAALLSIGKYAIGRPSCMGGVAILSATIARLRIRQAVIIADNDEDKLNPDGRRWNPGLDGAQKVANDIGVPCCILVLPCKDSRDFLINGGTAQILDSLVNNLIWKTPK